MTLDFLPDLSLCNNFKFASFTTFKIRLPLLRLIFKQGKLKIKDRFAVHVILSMSTGIPKKKIEIKKGRIIPLEHTLFTFK